MGTRRNRGLLAVIAAGLILVGCASSEPEEQPDTSASQQPDQSTTRGEDMSATRPEPEAARPPRIIPGGGIEIFNPGMNPDTLRGVFYFDFDQAIIKRAGHSELDKHADVLQDNRSYRVRLEGHADERGTREYNLALGERRANAIRSYLIAQGASRGQIEVVSYGEEKPVVMGSNESAWARNRRVEIKYRN